MIKLPALELLAAASLFTVVAGNAWSEEGAPVEQTAPPAVVSDTGYAPTPYHRGYEPYWQPPPLPAPPRGYYGHYPPYYPPYPQYHSAPAAPVENPLSAELKQTQEQLAAKTAELDTASEQLASLQAEQAAIREVMQQAQAELAKASEQLSVVLEEMDILNEVLAGLKARLDVQDTSLLGALNAGAAAEDGAVDSPSGSEAGKAQSPATTPSQPINTESAETVVPGSDETQPGAEQGN